MTGGAHLERTGTWRSAGAHAAARTYPERCCACAARSPLLAICLVLLLIVFLIFFLLFLFFPFLLLCHRGHGEAERGDAAVPVPGALQSADRGERARAAEPGRAGWAVSQLAAGGTHLWCRCFPWGSALACPAGEGPVRAGVSFGRSAGEDRDGEGVPGDARGFSGDAQEGPWGCL